MKPLGVDLFCGLGGWTEGFELEGWRMIGVDIERHEYNGQRYPALLILQDVRTLHGSQFRHAHAIVASSPCQEFSYRDMPWSRARSLPPPALGLELFAQAERIQREASEAAGRYIPMVQENVRGAQKWVGKAPWHFGNYYLWGDIPALMPPANRRDVLKTGDRNAHRASDGQVSSPHFTAPAEGFKSVGLNWQRGNPGQDFTRLAGEQQRSRHEEGRKQETDWFTGKRGGISAHSSKSDRRKAASAMIAKIPLRLSRHIAHAFYPVDLRRRGLALRAGLPQR